MKQQLSPAVVAGILFGVIIVTGLIFFGLTRSPAGSLEGAQSQGGGMPPEVAKEFAERMKSAQPAKPKTDHN